MSKVTPFLMFDKGVKEAFEFYHSVFKNSKILSMNDMGGMHSGEIEIEGRIYSVLMAEIISLSRKGFL